MYVIPLCNQTSFYVIASDVSDMSFIKKDVDKFFDQYVRSFIYHDIQAGIDGNANYMVALALVAYTEFMGGMLLGRFVKRSHRDTIARDKFNKFIQTYFPPCYITAEAQLKVSGRDLYDTVSNGLAHNYFIKLGEANFTIYLKTPLHCGITYDPINAHLSFNVTDYFRDFQSACDKYYSDLTINKNYIIEFQNAKTYLKF